MDALALFVVDPDLDVVNVDGEGGREADARKATGKEVIVHQRPAVFKF